MLSISSQHSRTALVASIDAPHLTPAGWLVGSSNGPTDSGISEAAHGAIGADQHGPLPSAVCKTRYPFATKLGAAGTPRSHDKPSRPPKASNRQGSFDVSVPAGTDPTSTHTANQKVVMPMTLGPAFVLTHSEPSARLFALFEGSTSINECSDDDMFSEAYEEAQEHNGGCAGTTEDDADSAEPGPNKPKQQVVHQQTVTGMACPHVISTVVEMMNVNGTQAAQSDCSSATADILSSQGEPSDPLRPKAHQIERSRPARSVSHLSKNASDAAERFLFPTRSSKAPSDPPSTPPSEIQLSISDASFRSFATHTGPSATSLISSATSLRSSASSLSFNTPSHKDLAESQSRCDLHHKALECAMTTTPGSDVERCGMLSKTVLSCSPSCPGLVPTIKATLHSDSLAFASNSFPAWHPTLNSGEREVLRSIYGNEELKRQNVISELCDSEIAFVDDLQNVVRIFIKPLRMRSGCWLRNVPKAIGQLFDWLEKILCLHNKINGALQARQAKQRPMIIRIADVFLEYVQHLRTHQPYLIRFGPTSTVIERLLKDRESKFGEFVRMQQNLPECGSMGLLSLLLKPIQRLMKYPLLFQRLCDLTPADHPDHLASLSLLHSTDAAIRAMQESKVREDEYRSIQLLASRIRNLPIGFNLAVRSRQLLAHGLLQRVWNPCRPPMSATPSPFHSPQPPNIAVNKTAQPMPSILPVLNHMSCSRRTRLLRELSFLDEASPDITAKSSVLPNSPKSTKEEPKHVFVFTDVVLFVDFCIDQNSASAHYEVMDRFGVGRVLAVADRGGRDHEPFIELSILPLNSHAASHEVFRPGTSTPVAIYLKLPTSSSSHQPNSKVDRQRWVAAFTQSLKTTLRALSASTSPRAPGQESPKGFESNGHSRPQSNDSPLPVNTADSPNSGMRSLGRRAKRRDGHHRKAVSEKDATNTFFSTIGAPPLPPVPPAFARQVNASSQLPHD